MSDQLLLGITAIAANVCTPGADVPCGAVRLSAMFLRPRSYRYSISNFKVFEERRLEFENQKQQHRLAYSIDSLFGSATASFRSDELRTKNDLRRLGVMDYAQSLASHTPATIGAYRAESVGVHQMEVDV